MTEPFAEYEEPHPDDIDMEAEADEAAEEERGESPLEADPADTAEQDRVVEVDEDDYR
jgi:hypothetical protein